MTVFFPVQIGPPNVILIERKSLSVKILAMTKLKLSKELAFNLVGLALLVTAFAFSLSKIGRRTAEVLDPNLKIIRFAHWQLEPGVREAFDAVSAEYTKLHPDVRLIQVGVPERAYIQYVSTQLVGGTAPDLIELQPETPLFDLYCARYFVPLSDVVNQPNPYMKGTPLEGKPWRETYLDGMQSAFNDRLMEYYGVPSTILSVRLFYNKTLLRKATGSDEAPRTYADFLRVSQAVIDYGKKTQSKLVPVAGSQDSAWILGWSLWNGVTGQEAARCDLNFDGGEIHAETFIGYINDKWNFASPGVRAGLEIMRQVGQFCQPGFQQLNRADSLFLFMQQKAAFLAGGSWDDEGIRKNAQFELGVCDFPFPGPDDPKYGRFSRERVAEFFYPHTQFGMVRFSRHPEAVIDFLHFLTSKRGNQLFCDKSGWLPAIRGVEPRPEKKVFTPDTNGSGHAIRLYYLNDTRNSVQQLSYLMFEDTNEFVRRYEPLYLTGGVSDVGRDARQKLDNLSRQQGMIDSYLELLKLAKDEKVRENLKIKYLTSIEQNVDIQGQRSTFLERAIAGGSKKIEQLKTEIAAGASSGSQESAGQGWTSDDLATLRRNLGRLRELVP